MGFQKGQPRPEKAGRKKGSKNVRSFDARELAEAKGCDPLEILIDIAKGDWKALGYESGEVVKFNLGMEYKEEVIKLSDRKDAAKEAAKYIYPQLKSMELTGKGGADLFTQRLMNAASRVENSMHTLVGDAEVEEDHLAMIEGPELEEGQDD